MLEWVDQEATNIETFPFSLEARDGDYDTYLFWPSLSNGMGGFNESFVRTNYKVTVLTFKPYEKNSLSRVLALAPRVRPCRLLFRLGHCTLGMSCVLLSCFHVDIHTLQSPLSLAPPSVFHSPSPCGDETLDNSSSEVWRDGVQEKGSFPKYSRTFNMGLLLTVRRLLAWPTSFSLSLLTETAGGASC